MIALLGPATPFPDLGKIRDDLGGLLAIGGGLSPERLLSAYRQGLFPWGTHDGLPLWYNPDPRMVLFPDEFRLHPSLRKTLRKGHFRITVDQHFAQVIDACAQTPRPGQNGTWISREMREAYQGLFDLGWAHSVETWLDERLVGGLYGLAIGRVFYGESMFSHATDASKFAFAHLVRLLQSRSVGLIDCQMKTAHLASLGAREISRQHFLEHLARLNPQAPSGAATQSRWQSEEIDPSW